MSLAGLGYFYNRYIATEKIIQNFRKFYPIETLIFINDNGLPELETIANQNGAVYMPYDENLTTGNDCDDIEVMIKWIERFFAGLEHITEEYIIILEDDVCILKPVSLNLKYEMNGFNPKALLPENITTYLKQFNNKINQDRIHYGGCGGCILKTQFFKDMSKLNWKEELYKYAEMTKRPAKNIQSWYFNDTCLSFLCWRYGGVVGVNEEWNELYTPDDNELQSHIKNNKTSILHRFRKYF